MVTTQYKQADKGKRAAIVALFAGAVLIVAAGVAFAAYSWIYHVNFTVMSMNIPGFVFAAIAVFLGVRYFRSVQKISKTLYGSSQSFNWTNFKISKARTKKMEG